MEFDVEKSTNRVDGETPSHKITVKDLSQKISIFWYVKSNEALSDFDKMKHMDLVKLIHAKSTELRPGGFKSFQSGVNDYHLKHIGEGEYIIKVLK
jgi:hypothetical protein